jgi:NAD(P)-dependent dehydrogenase (short-subunit alcohol dehydrogenase family)
MKLLESKVCLITGAARGIGRAICEAYVAHGASVVVADIDASGAQTVSQAINAAYVAKSVSLALDVSDPTSVQGAIDATLAEFGRLDVLVNDAAVMRAHAIVDFPLADWQQVFKVNMEGTFLCSQAAARQMIRQGDGCIINIAAASARKADRGHAAYSSSKAAVITFTRILALELGEYGIRANAILPGATETDMLAAVFQQVPGLRKELIAKTTLGKLGAPRDQANVAIFLASDLASHITGEYIVVSGGEFMNA